MHEQQRLLSVLPRRRRRLRSEQRRRLGNLKICAFAQSTALKDFMHAYAMAGRSWKSMQPCVVIAWDLETTGPDPLQHEIVEFAAVSEERSFSIRVRPRRGRITPAAAAIHGIHDSHVSDAPNFPKAFACWVDFLLKHVPTNMPEHHLTQIILVGHNTSCFDNPMLAAELCCEYGVEEVSLHLAKVLPQVSLWTADTLIAARKAKKRGSLDTASLCLTHLVENLTHQPLENAHAALADAAGVLRIVPLLADDLECIPWLMHATCALRKRLANKLLKQPHFTSAVRRSLNAPPQSSYSSMNKRTLEGMQTSSVLHWLENPSNLASTPSDERLEKVPEIRGDARPIQVQEDVARTGHTLHCRHCGAMFSYYFKQQHEGGSCAAIRQEAPLAFLQLSFLGCS